MKNDAPNSRHGGWIYFVLILVFGMIVFRDAMLPGRVLFTTDDSVGAMSMRKSTFPEAFLGGWYDISAAGFPMYMPINFTNAVLAVLSPRLFMNWIHLLDLVIGSWFLMLFLRLRGIGWIAAVLGALLTYWFGSTFFLTYAGHLGKFGAVMFAGVYLYCVERAVRDRSILLAVCAGAAMAGMFVEQQDSALFFSLVLGPYALFRVWQSHRFHIPSYARLLVPMLAVAGCISLHSVYSAYSFYRMDGVEEGNKQSAQELWDYCTQWSWPPAETIEFIAPGYMGWRSGEPSGPYWGALGRSPQWQPQFGPNGMNFKLETFYTGFLPIMFMFLACYASVVRKRVDASQRQQAIFWLCALLATFVLACGKYTPIYRLFFALPGISSIRNPVKFMQITQFAMGYLAACGLDYWLKSVGHGPAKNDPDRPVLASFARGMLYVAAAMTAITLVLAVKYSGSVGAFNAEGWQGLAEKIVGLRLQSMIHATVIAWIGYGLLRLGSAGGTVKNASWRNLGWAVLVVVMVDQLLVSFRYVRAVDQDSLVSRGDLIPDLQRDLGNKRAYLWSPPPNVNSQWQGIYNQWQTILLPNYQIPLLNLVATRLSSDYELFYQVMNAQPVRMWQHMALGLVLTPADFWMQVRNDPSLRGVFEPVAGYNVVQVGGSGVSTMRTSGQQPAQHVLLRNTRNADRFALVTAWSGAELGDAIRSLATTEPLSRVVITPSVPSDWPGSGAPGRTGTVEMTAYRSGRAELSVRTDKPAVLRASDKYTPDWKAWVDGVRVPVLRCDGIFMGVMVKPSSEPQKVVLEFRPERATLYLQLAGIGLTVLAMLVLLFGGGKSRHAESPG